MIKISKKDPIRATAKGIMNDLSTRKKIGAQSRNERNKYV